MGNIDSSFQQRRIVPVKKEEIICLSSTKQPLNVEFKIKNYGNEIIPKGSMIVNSESTILKFQEMKFNNDIGPNEVKNFNLKVVFPDDITPDDYYISGFLRIQKKNYLEFFYPISIYNDKDNLKEGKTPKNYAISIINSIKESISSKLSSDTETEDQNYKQKYEELLEFIQKKKNIQICGGQCFEILSSNEITII